MTLRSRLALAFALIAIVLLSSALAILTIVHSSLVDEIDRQLEAAAPIASGGALRDGGGARVPSFPGSDGPAARVTELFIGRYDEAGNLVTVLQGVTNAAPPAVSLAAARAHATPPSTPRPFTASATNGAKYRAVAIRTTDGSIAVLALPTSRLQSTYRSMRLGVGLATAIVLVVLALVVWWVSRLGLRPIKQVTDAAVAIAAGDLHHRVEAQPRGTEAGQLATAFNVMVDERQATEARLRQFVADASHELRTPLSTVAGVLELYRGGSLPDLDEALDRASQETDRMSNLITDLLLLAHLDQGIPLERAPVDLSQLVEDAAFDVTIQDRGRLVTTDVTTGVVVNGDEARLRQVVANLVTNALTHTPRDTSISIGVRATEDTCTLIVRDEGPGMASDQAAHIFDRFFRIDRGRARKTGGSGLGLSIVASIVAAHDGTVHVDTAPGEGTTFHVTLPRERASAPLPPETPSR